MVSHTHLILRRVQVFVAAVALVAAPLLLFSGTDRAVAQDKAIYAPGEPIITGFSGVVPPNPPPASGDPIDQTFIDLDGTSMVIQQLQPDGPPSGQLIPSPTVFSAKARDVGQVFGIALDDAPVPNIYLSATSAFGLQLVVPDANGAPERSKLGAPGAQFMAGQWGTVGGAAGTPGSIYKVDGTTGEISLFTTIANSGAGLGDIVFDKATEQFFVSDLDTGLIYRLDATGAILDTFDHGVAGRPDHSLAPVADDGSEINVTDPSFNTEDPKTWGFTQAERKVYGLAMHGGRLYYAVADGPQIWSIGIKLDGSFANDARWELDVTGLPSANEITNIVFDNEGRMILAQRGPQVGSYDYTVFAEPKTSSVVRYTREVPDDPTTPSAWIETPDSYAIGFRPDGANATGGIALGYGLDPRTQTIGGVCSSYLWSTGESLRDNPALTPPLDPPAQVHGLQGNDHNLVRPRNDPPTMSYFTDYDGNTADDQAQYQGHIGAVQIWQQCEGGPGYGYIPPYMPPPDYVPPDSFNLTLTKAATPRTCFAGNGYWFCGFTIRVENTGSTPYWGPVSVDDWLPNNDPGASMSFGPTPPWNCSAISGSESQCDYPPVLLYPGDSLDLYETVKLPMKGYDICYLDNAASIVWPYGMRDDNPHDDYDFASARVPDQNCRPPQGPKTNLKLEKVAHPKDCLQGSTGWDCIFYIKVTNTGPGDYNAPIQVKDTLGLAIPATEWPSPPWSCSQAGANITCDHPAQLLHPGQAVWLGVSATIPYGLAKDKQICRLDNRAQITKAPGGSNLNVDPSDDQDGATATIPSDECNPNRPRTDLSITKDGLDCRTNDAPATLVPVGGSASVCIFRVTVKNQGPGNFNAPITVHDVFAPPVPPALVISSPPPGLCTPAGTGYDCTSPGPVSLVPGQTWSFFIAVKVPANSQVCDIKNGVKITSPAGGTPLNVNPGNDTAGASDHVPNCDPNRGRTDLSLIKTPADCLRILTLAVAGSQACFDVTIKNQGPGNFNGPLHFSDNANVPGTLVSGAGATCSPVGSGYDCGSTGNVPLTPGQSVTYHLTGTFQTQNGEYCRVNNIAKLTSPAGGSVQNTNPANDTGSATDPLKGAGCGPVAACSIRQKMPDGGCCPDNTFWNGRVCTDGTHRPPVFCPPGTTGNFPNCVPVQQTCQRPLVGTFPDCHRPIRLCPPGTTGNFPNCVPVQQTCEPPLVGTYPDCHRPIRLCPPGTTGNFPNCVPMQQTCEPPLVGIYPDCHRPIRLCPPGTTGNFPNCVPVQQTCEPPLVGTYPDCHRPIIRVCPKGSTGIYPDCVQQTCEPPLVGTYPDCHRLIIRVCPKGSTGIYPDCVQQTCEPPLVGTYPDCHRPFIRVCPRGTTGVFPDCAKPSDNGGGIVLNPGILKNPGILLNPGIIEEKHCPADSVGRYPDCTCKRGTTGTPGKCTGVLLRINPGILLNNENPPAEVIK
jgi:hypothetical protein